MAPGGLRSRRDPEQWRGAGLTPPDELRTMLTERMWLAQRAAEWEPRYRDFLR
jgi:hypothetical protein